MEEQDENKIYAEKLELKDIQPESKTMDAGFWIALVAILISVATAFISLYEANIMKNQQKIMMEKKNGSAWPYIHVSP